MKVIRRSGGADSDYRAGSAGVVPPAVAHRKRSPRVWVRLLAAVALAFQGALAGVAVAAPEVQATDEEPIVAGGVEVGRHYRQTGSGTGLGYDVREPFYAAMQALGGPTVAGFPVSAPFQAADGCTYQDFQVVLLQACPGQEVQRANTFQVLEEFGADPRLEQLGIGRGLTDGAATFAEAVTIRLAWLEDAAIRERFLSQCGDGDAGAAIQLCGLPMNRPQSFGPFISQRFQRIAFQRWLADGPGGITAGHISPSLGGDLLKEIGVLSGIVVRPHALGQAPPLAVVPFNRVGAAGVAALTGPAGTAVPAQATPNLPSNVTTVGVAQLGGAAGPGAAVGAAGAPTAGGRAAPLQFGFQGDFFRSSIRPQTIRLITGAGFGWAKQQVLWDQYEISSAGCATNRANCLELVVNGKQKYFKRDALGFLDAVVNDITASGLNLLVSVVRAPAFLAVRDGHAPADPQSLADFLQFLAGRYRGKIKAIETWNEQNLSWEWGGARLWGNAPAAPPQGVVDFVALQKAAYQGVKAGDPTIVVVLPALTPTGLGECWLDAASRAQAFCLDQVRTAVDDRLYLDFMYQVNGGEIRSYYDVLGVHPSGYNNPPDDTVDRSTVPTTGFKGHGSFYVTRYQQLREVQLRYGDTKPMWFTEVGWASTRSIIPGYEFGRDNTEDQRGRYLARLLEQVDREAPYVTNVIIWNLNFRQLVGETDEKHGFGVVNADGSPTPSYTCAADFVKSGNRITRPECRL